MIELHARRFGFAIALASLLPATFPGSGGVVEAQGVTTASISGFVTDPSGSGVASADVEVVNRANGVSTRSRSRDGGRYTAAGLEVGGPYSVVVRRLGFLKQTRDGIFLTIGQDLRVDVALDQQAVTLQAVTSRASTDRGISRAQSGVGSFISDSAIRRLPTVNRDIYGLVRLVPQITTWYGLSAAGASPRMNGIMIDGASDQGLYGGNAAAAIWGGKPISIEAVKEYQVL